MVLELLLLVKGVMRGDWDKGLLSGLRLWGDMLELRSNSPLPLVPLVDENTPLPLPVILPTPLVPKNAAVPCKLP